MKEFIDKLISRLEEQKTKYREIRKNTYCRRTEMDDCDSCRADHYLDARLEGINKAKEIVNKLAEEYKGGWIPCSERLPEVNGWYLVTNELGVVQQQHWGASHWEKLRDEAVLAWMPLPAPYTEGE